MERWFSGGALQPMLTILHHHEQTYRETQQFIESPPGDLRIIEIFPPRVLASNALGSRIASLNQDYHLGRRCGRYFMATLGQWLSDAEPQTGLDIVTPAAPVANEPNSGAIVTPLAGNDDAWNEGSLA